MKYFTTSKLSNNIRKTPEGFLLCLDVPIARTGVQIYGAGETPIEADTNGQVEIDRPEEEVFKDETLASFEGKPVTIGHPDDYVTPDNWSELAVGVTQNVRRGEGDNASDIIADLLITNGEAIAAVEDGLREVSCGYEAEYFQIKKGKGVQKNIIGNHVALVKQGRAGASYAIKDHKGKGEQVMKLQDKIKAIFAKAQDEAMKIAADESAIPEKKTDDAQGYDELVKIVKDLAEKVGALAKPKDEAKPEEKKPEAKPEAKEKSDDQEVNASLEERLKALEAMVAKIVKAEGEEAEVLSGDEELEEEEEESSLTGDEISRVEILAPGLKASKDIKAEALKAAYSTKDGKKVIEALNGGKAPAFDSAEKVETLFIAASEVLKATRSSELAGTKQTRDSQKSSEVNSTNMTADKMNEINANFYKRN